MRKFTKTSLSASLLLGMCLAGCPTRTIYYDAGGDGSVADGPGGHTSSGGFSGTTSAGGSMGSGGQKEGTGGFGGHSTGGSGTGGASGGGAGGTVGSGGIAATGGSGNMGGAVSTGGRSGMGGANSTGGKSGTGGTNAAGGAPGSGGMVATGGTGPSTGGHEGTGGIPGTGGAAGAPPKVLGVSCSSGTECASGHCSAGVCCDQACQGVCQQCSASGHCQMPQDDAACGVVSCPADTTCRDYATSITANRCKQLGQCKTAADCSFVAAATTRSCGLYNNDPDFLQFCDGAGNCVNHSVSCGGDGACAVGDNVCCAVGAGFSCLSATVGCQRQSGGAPPTGPYDCQRGTDCLEGSVCCGSQGVNGVSTHCSQDCSSSYMVQVLQICNPAASLSECQSGTCQPAPNTWNLPPGFYACQ